MRFQIEGNFLLLFITAGGMFFAMFALLLHLFKRAQKSAGATKDSESLLRAVVDSTAEGIITIDENGIVRTFNKACERIFGYQPGEVIGNNIRMLMPESNQSAEELIIGTVGREVEGRRKDDTVFPLELSISAVSIAGRRIFSGIMRDITERKQSEERLELAIEKLTESNKQLERFAYICSHDLQEPLRMISNYTQQLARHLDGDLDEKGKHYMLYVTDGAQRARELIKSILTYARIGAETEKPDQVNCNEVMEKTLQDLEQAIAESQAVINCDLLPVVTAHATHIMQIFQNLLTNAIKFRGAEPLVVHVGAHMKGDAWEFSVRDNGIGISPQYNEKVFVIFQRLNRREEYPGTGIGLAICKKIIEQCNGRIWLESEPGKGTTFFFTLPARPNYQEELHEPETTHAYFTA